jgi:hypothetical protein
MEQNHKPAHEHQRRLNNAMREVVKKEVLKLLKAGVIYPVSDSELGEVSFHGLRRNCPWA